jgi:N utilization substance protein B
MQMPTTNRIKSNTRFYAIEIVYQILLLSNESNENISDSHINTMIQEVVDLHKNGVAVPMLKNLVQGFIQHKKVIRDTTRELLKKDISSVSVVNLSIIYLGVFEILYTQTEYQIIISNYIQHAYTLGTSQGYALVNAILDKLVQKKLLNGIC